MAGVASVRTDEDVDSLTMREAIRLCRDRKIKLEAGNSDLYLLKYIIKCEVLSKGRSLHQLVDFLKEKLLDEKKRKHGLSEIYAHTLNFSQTITAMNDPVIDDINRMFPDVCKTLERQKERVLDEVAPVLILGETGSGKSTFINLLLNDDILPCSLLSNTHVICEIRHNSSKRRRQPFQTRTPDTPNIGGTGREHYETPGEPIDMEGSEVETVPEYRAELELYSGEIRKIVMVDNDKEKFKVKFAKKVQRIEPETGRSLYRVVRLYVPCPLLKNGLMIVDSPGVGESQAMEDVVMSYVTNAAAFIYVIDSTNAGGVQERVSRLLSNVFKTTFTEADPSENAFFRPQIALFICNKWDEVELTDREAVLKDTRKRIKDTWTGCEDDQVIPFSSVEAQFIQKRDGVAPRFGKVLDKIQELIPQAHEMVIAKGHMFLDQYLTRCITTFETHLTDVSLGMDERKKKRQNTKDRFEQLNEKVNIFFKDQKETLAKNIDRLAQHLKDYLSQESVTQKICTGYDIPDDKEEWNRVAVQIRIKVYERFREKIKDWEDTQNILSKTVEDMKRGLKETFPALEKEIFSLENEMTGKTARTKQLDISLQENDESGPDIVPQFIRNKFVGRSFGLKIAIGLGLAPLILAGVVVRLPYVGFTQLEKIITKHKMENEFKNALQRKDTNELIKVCESYARKTVHDVTDKMNLKSIIEEDLQFLFKSIDAHKKKMENQIQSDLNLLKKLKNEQREDEEIQKIYEPQKEKFKILLLQLKHFMVMNNPSWVKGIKIVDKMKLSGSVMCAGVMADVVEGERDSLHKVWVRKPKEKEDYHKIDSHISVLVEYCSGRKSSELAQCVGVWSPGMGENVLYQVLEPLHSSLRVFLRSPGPDFLNNRHNNYQMMARDIVQGLAYLHDKQLVHVDLSLDTIAVDYQGKTKLTNISQPHRVKIVPEIQDGKVQLDRYSHLTPRLFETEASAISEASTSFMTKSTQQRTAGNYDPSIKKLASDTRQKLKYNGRDDLYSVGIVMWEMWKKGLSVLGTDILLEVSTLLTPKQVEKRKRGSFIRKSVGSKSELEESEESAPTIEELVLKAIHSRLVNLRPLEDPCFEKELRNHDKFAGQYVETIKQCLKYNEPMSTDDLLARMAYTYPHVTIYSASPMNSCANDE